SACFVLFFYTARPDCALHSFPTRRSSDLGLAVDTEHGGQGLPSALSTPVVEMLNSACMGWALCPLLSAGAIDMLAAHGSTEQKRSEEHTSELQSLAYLVCRLLLEKKKT